MQLVDEKKKDTQSWQYKGGLRDYLMQTLTGDPVIPLFEGERMAEAKACDRGAQLMGNGAGEHAVGLQERRDPARHRAEGVRELAQRGEPPDAGGYGEAPGADLLGGEVQPAQVAPERPHPEEDQDGDDRELDRPVHRVGKQLHAPAVGSREVDRDHLGGVAHALHHPEAAALTLDRGNAARLEV